MWEHFLTNPVRVVSVATSTNPSGDDLRPDLSSPAAVAAYAATSPGTAYMASVQQATARYAIELAEAAGVQGGVAGYTVYFGSEPTDPTNASRPRLRARDLILWTTPSGATRALYVAGPVRDEGGAGAGWGVDCLEVA